MNTIITHIHSFVAMYWKLLAVCTLSFSLGFIGTVVAFTQQQYASKTLVSTRNNLGTISKRVTGNKSVSYVQSKLFSSPPTQNNFVHVEHDASGMPIIPKDVVKYSQVPKQTEYFTFDNTPVGLRKNHSTKEGTWGKICINKGSLDYTIIGDGEDKQEKTFTLDDMVEGVIVPTQLHYVTPITEDLEFVVEFYRLPGTGPVKEEREGL